MKKRMLSALLCLCMMLTMIPAAFAVEDETADTPVESGQVDTVPDDTSSDTTSITTQEALEEAIKSAPVGDTITLDGDIEVASTIRITGKNITLNMNGHQIYNESNVWNQETDSWSLVSVGSGAELTIEGNGTFQTLKDDCYAIDIVDGGRCIIKNGEFNGNISAVYVLEGDLVVNGGRFSIQQTDQNKEYAFLLNCFDENYKNGKARITVNGGTFENFNPRACAAESTGNTTNFCASGCIVEETTQDNNNKNYTVTKLNNGQMAVIPEQSEPGSVSASLEGTYTSSTEDFEGSTGAGEPSGSVQNDKVSVNLTPDNSASATSASLNVAADTAKSMAENGATLEVKSKVGTLTVSNDALKTISSNAKGEAVTLSIANTTEEGAAEGAATYKLTAKTADGNDVFTESTGTIEVSVPAPTDVTQDNVHVYYLGPNGAEKVSATVNESNVIWTVNHFSTYLVTATEQDISVTDKEGNTKTYTDLKTAINTAEESSTITLLADVALTPSTNVTKSIILDLNGYTVTGLDDAYSLRIHGSGVSVTIKDGSGTGKGKITSGRDDNGGIVQVADAAALTLESGTIEATGANGGCPVLVMGKGAISNDSKGATFNMTGGTLKANGYFALAGNGTWDGTTINISGGTITSAKSAGIYHPQEGTLTLTGGTISGTTAVQICAGTLSIPSNSKVTITATGEDNREGKTGDGLIDDGSAVSVVNRAGYGDVPKVTIAGGTFVSENETPVLSYAWKDDGVDNDGTRVKGFVSGGSFSDSVSEYVNNTLRAELVKSSGNAPYSYYQNVATALNAAQRGDMINDLAVSDETNTCTVTLDYNDNSGEDTVLTVAKNTSITLPSPNRFGYTFRHWSDGSETYSAGMTVTINDDITFTAVWRSNSSSSGSSSGGGSSSSSNRYTVSVDSGIDNGSVSVSPSRAERGDTVTITIDPDEGYELDSLTVRDSRGNRIDVERQSDTRYTFEMPSGRVTVDATFTEVAETPETPDQIGSFTDVDTDDWFADAVQYMLDNGMMNGVTDTTFGPGTTTTRGMIVTILYRLEGEPDTTASSFTDAASGMYYADAVAWAQANSIVTGITETIFAPDQAITREQMAAILYRYAQYKGYDVTASNDLSSYTDASRISAYATAAMQWANAEGLITGNTSTTINPTGNATRAEVATILMRFCENIAK